MDEFFGGTACFFLFFSHKRMPLDTHSAEKRGVGPITPFYRLTPNAFAVLFLLFAAWTDAVAGARDPSLFESHVPPEPNITDLPPDFAFSIYRSAIARLAFGQPESVVEPLFYLAESDPELADVQNALAAVIYFTQAVHRDRALYYAKRAVNRDPDNAIFRVTRVLTDPKQAVMSRDGSVFLTSEATKDLRISRKSLAAGSPNQRSLAEILEAIKREGKTPTGYPYYFAGFSRLLSKQGLLFTSPSKAQFEKLESKVDARLAAVAAEAVEAKQRYEKARGGLERLRKKWGGASIEERERIREQASQWREELEQSMKLAMIANAEFDRFQAFLENDWSKLQKERIAQETEFESIVAAGSAVSADVEVNHQSPLILAPEAFGRYFALVIGSNNYQHMKELRTAIRDAEAVASLLKSDYGFYEVETKKDASRQEIIDALAKLRARVTPQDNLLVYYAGHGYFDKTADEGYWLPTNAGTTNAGNWVSDSEITKQVRAIDAKQTIIIADSCYSGTLTRTRGQIPIQLPEKSFLKRMAESRAGVIITSGSIEPVYDGHPSGHSVFARELLEVLKKDHAILKALEIYNRIKERMEINVGSDQVPSIGFIEGHDPGADFLFIKRRR